MREKSRRETPNPRREAEMYRVDAIQSEMAESVRLLGGQGKANEQNRKAAKASSLPQTVIERLRWRKIKRVPADIADAVREAVRTHNEEALGRAKHEAFLARQQNAVLRARLMAVDPDFYGPEIDALGRNSPGDGFLAD